MNMSGQTIELPGSRGNYSICRLWRYAAFFLIPCLTGCEFAHQNTFTGRWWDYELENGIHQPATDAKVAVSETREGKDLLVEYDEIAERNRESTEEIQKSG